MHHSSFVIRDIKFLHLDLEEISFTLSATKTSDPALKQSVGQLGIFFYLPSCLKDLNDTRPADERYFGQLASFFHEVFRWMSTGNR
jgi:hypothetical protein